ncbi:MAG: type II 3-dehydroquinate dehydratase [Actinomycetota bacterium]
MAHHILVLNGPNLNLLGLREPDVYGSATLDDVVSLLSSDAAQRGASIKAVQSNHEGELIDALHDARGWASGVVFNPGGYTHTSVALRDSITAIEIPVVETHVSNVHAREAFRHTSMLAAVCLGVVAGFGPSSYRVALHGLLDHLDAAAR